MRDKDDGHEEDNDDDDGDDDHDDDDDDDSDGESMSWSVGQGFISGLGRDARRRPCDLHFNLETICG